MNLSPVESESSLVTRAMRSPAAGRVEANGRFTLSGVVPGVYRLTGSSPSSGWFLESAVIEGQNTLDVPIEIKPGQNLTGATVTDPAVLQQLDAGAERLTLNDGEKKVQDLKFASGGL